MAESTLNSASITPEELDDLLDEIENILPNGDENRINGVLERLATYNGLDENQRNIVENFENALTLRAVLSSQSPDEYLTGVERGSLLDTSGAFGHVYRGTWNKQNVAVKIFRDVEPPEHIEGDYKERFEKHVEPLKAFKEELRLWKFVSTFENVWSLKGITMWLDRGQATVIFALVSPLAESNLKLSRMNKMRLTPEKFANHFYDVATGLKILHENNVIHGDIHHRNILQNEGHCYLVDFGISKFLGQSSSFSFARAVAEVQRVPELLTDGSALRNRCTDIFSFGNTMYQVLAYEHEYQPVDPDTGPMRPKSRAGPEWDHMWNLVRRCMLNESTNRPTASQLVEELKELKGR